MENRLFKFVSNGSLVPFSARDSLRIGVEIARWPSLAAPSLVLLKYPLSPEKSKSWLTLEFPNAHLFPEKDTFRILLARFSHPKRTLTFPLVSWARNRC